MAAGPTQRTLEALRKDGWTCAVAEKWIPQTRQRSDLFGGIDIVALKENRTLGVQCTSASNVSSRVKKLTALPGMRAWLEAGNWLEVWGWAKRGKAGKRKLWTRSIHEITLDELTPPDAAERG